MHARPRLPLKDRRFQTELRQEQLRQFYESQGAVELDPLLVAPDGHLKLLHLWPVKLLQAGRSDYDYAGVMAMREAASFRR